MRRAQDVPQLISAPGGVSRGRVRRMRRWTR